MRTLQEKYNGIQEGKFSKENFLADARKELPNLVTRFNGYDDAVQILKNRGMIQEVRVEEARLTNKSLTDYRYKPTNDMDKYPYEQILRGIRVELEGLGVQGTPTAEEYAKALAKVSKNLAKDSIFYTNQVAGVNPKVDLHDKMVPVTAKNSVDTFNGMKKAELKEGFKKLIKKVLSEKLTDVESYKGEDEFDMYGDDEADDIPHPRGYEDQDEIEYDEENLEESAMGDIHILAQEAGTLKDFLQSVKAQHPGVDLRRDIEELQHIWNNREQDEVNYNDIDTSDSEIDYDDENFSDPFIDDPDFQFESKSLKDLL